MHKSALARGRWVIVATMLVLPASAAAAPGGNSEEAPSGRYIVVLKDGADAGAVAAEHGRKFGVKADHVYHHSLKGYAAVVPQSRLKALKEDALVEFVSPDLEVHALAQTLPTGINRTEADLSSQRSGDGTYPRDAAGSSMTVKTPVAVLDTGSGSHSDINVVGGKSCSGSSSYSDGNGHGTHVAGIIGAKDDGSGVVGVAPRAPIYSVRVLNSSGSGSYSSIICGIDWVTNNAASKGIKVANMSLGGWGYDDGNCGYTNSDAMHRAICGSVNRGITYVVAAGNSASDFANMVPAAYNEVLTVTAMADFNGVAGGGGLPTCRSDVDDTAADFSSYTRPGSGDEGHTIAAPGVCIKSTWKGGGYNTISGTSMAAPHVAGNVALCIHSGACAGLSPSDIISKMRGDAQVFANANSNYGYSGDPQSPEYVGGALGYFGSLMYAGGY